jgi:hypothetical protein
VRTSLRRRAAAERGRYTYVVSRGISVGELEAGSVRNIGIFAAVPADRATKFSRYQRRVGACCTTSRVTEQQRWSATLIGPCSPSESCTRPLVGQQVLGIEVFRAFANSQGITSHCSVTSHDKVLAPRRCLRPAELGR